jgi:hypothetical protein
VWRSKSADGTSPTFRAESRPRLDLSSRVWPALLPELLRFPADDRARAIGLARETRLDLLELAGMAAALVALTALTRYVLGDALWAATSLAAVFNFFIALPLLVVGLGPFHVRRLRRGLRGQLDMRTES